MPSVLPHLKTPPSRSLRRALAGVASALLLGALAVYRLAVSPLLHGLFGGGCRFSPTCSAYAAESIRLHGPWRGGRKALGRLLRCHPLSPGGFDPPTREP